MAELKTPVRQSWSEFFSSHWFVILLVTAFIVTIVSLIIRALLPEEVPVAENTWNDITPGFSHYEQLVEKMGPPLETIETEDGFNLKYQSDFLALPNQVVTDKAGTVQFIREFLIYDPAHLLTQYTDLYGSPDLVLDDLDSSLALKANVFLDQGLVIVAHVKDGSVEQKWYFAPTTEQIFLDSWGNRLSETGPPPEGLP